MTCLPKRGGPIRCRVNIPHLIKGEKIRLDFFGNKMGKANCTTASNTVIGKGLQIVNQKVNTVYLFRFPISSISPISHPHTIPYLSRCLSNHLTVIIQSFDYMCQRSSGFPSMGERARAVQAGNDRHHPPRG